MLVTLIGLCSSLKPVVLIPGLFGSILDGDVTQKKYWYCPKVKDDNVWFNDRYVIPPTYNCLFDDIRLEWDEKTQNVKQPDYVNLSVVDFGGLQGINNVDTAIFNIHIVPYYGVITERLEKEGYIERNSMFGAPFDWRRGLNQEAGFWDKYAKLIEEAYEKNHEKVVIIGHSMGCYVTNMLLAKYRSKEWCDKYVDSAIYIAPSVGGSGVAFETQVTHKFPFIEFLGEYPETVQAIQGLHVHMPNHVAFGDTIVGYKKTGEPLYARNLTDYLVQEGKLQGNYLKMHNMMKEFFEAAPPQPQVRVAVLWNSGLPTLKGFDFRAHDPIRIEGGGDTLVNEEGPKYICSHWKDVHCLDFATVDLAYNHLLIMYQKPVLEFIVNWLKNN